MPFMVLLAARFWTLMLYISPKYLKGVMVVVLVGLLFLPARHMAVNSPNDYVDLTSWWKDARCLRGLRNGLLL